MRLKLLSSIIFLLCISLFLSLGFWQLDRADEKNSIIKLYQDRQKSAPEKLSTFSNFDLESKKYKKYKIKGRYLNKTFLIDNKIKNKKPGFNVISLFKLSSKNEIIVVDRGWIEMRGTRDSISKNFEFLNNQNIAKNVQEINGYIYPRSKSYTIGDISTDSNWPRLLQAVNFDEIKENILEKDFLVSGIVFRLGPENKFGFDRSWQIISMSGSKHLGYAFQWFAMAIALVIMIIIFFKRKKNDQKN